MIIDPEKLLQTNISLRKLMFRDFRKPKKYGTHQSNIFSTKCKKCKKFCARFEMYPAYGGGMICKSCYKEGKNEINKKSKSKNDGKIQSQPTPKNRTGF